MNDCATEELVPRGYRVGCLLALVGLLTTLVMHRRGVAQLRANDLSAKRLLYQLIVGLAPAIAVFNYLAVTSPPFARVALLAQHIMVAVTMFCFMELLLLLLYRTSIAHGASEEADFPGIANVLQQWELSFSKLGQGFEASRYMEQVMSILSRQPPVAFWASPPIGCFFAACPSLPCGQPQVPSPRLVALLRRAVVCYAVGAVVAPLLDLWMAGAPGLAAHRGAAERLARGVESGVTLLALYSLFITYRLSRAPLQHYHTTLKFAAVKILVFVTPVQRALLVATLGTRDGSWWQHVMAVLQSPLLALLLFRAFPPSELPSQAISMHDTASFAASFREEASPEEQRLMQDV